MNGIVQIGSIFSFVPYEDQSTANGKFVVSNGAYSGAGGGEYCKLSTAATDIPIGVIIDGGVDPTTLATNRASSTTRSVASAMSTVVGMKSNDVVLAKLTGTPGTIVPGSRLQLHTDACLKLDATSGARTVVAEARKAGAGGDMIPVVLLQPEYHSS
jgi:hypothetical protein